MQCTRLSVPDEQLALEGLVSLSGTFTTGSSSSSSSFSSSISAQSPSSQQRGGSSLLPWNASVDNAAGHDDKPASEKKRGVWHATSPTRDAVEEGGHYNTRQRRKATLSAKDALKHALAEPAAAPYVPAPSIHAPSTFFGPSTAVPLMPGSAARSSFSLPPLPPLHSLLSAPASPSSSTSSATSSRSSSFSGPSLMSPPRSPSSSAYEPPPKRQRLEEPSTPPSPSSSPQRRSSFVPTTVPLMEDPPEDAQLIPVTAHLPQGDICIHIEKPVLDALTASGISPESIVHLIVQNDKESRDQVIRETGFSTNYIMKLQRRVLHSSSQLQLPPPVRHSFGPGNDLHVLFDSEGGPLFMKKELCSILGMKGTTFSYWKKKSNVEDTDTSKDFRLMDICRTLFGGRATYTLYSPAATLTILNEMETSRQKNSFTNLAHLKYIITTYGRYGQEATKILAQSARDAAPAAAVPPAQSIPASVGLDPSLLSAAAAHRALVSGPSAAADAVSKAHSAAC